MPALDILKFTSKLNQNGDGLWVSHSERSISYPQDGNDSCQGIETDSFWFNHRNKVIITLVTSFSPSGPLFDVGAGNGYVAMALQRSGIDTVAVEPGTQGAHNAKTRGLHTVIRATLEDCDFQDHTIPAFGLFDVLEHIPNDAEFLRCLYRQLLPEGYLYVTVPAYNFLWSIDDAYAQHHRRYTVTSLRKSLQKAGFVVKYCSYFFFVLAPAIFIFRTLPSRLRFRRANDMSSISQQHIPPPGILGKIIDRALTYEFLRIENKKTLPAGGSCIAVAQKRRTS